MATGQYGAVLRHVQRLFDRGTVAGMTEGQLLRRFATERDEAAFTALLARHGPMVLGVCRALLSDPHDVEDAFQATFLVLVRKAGTLGEKDVLGAWLYGVARRVALKARSQAARRHVRESYNVHMFNDEGPAEDLDQIDLRPIVHEELDRLPWKYRDPIVLCYLEGLTHEQAAAQLGWPVGTVKGRLARARDLLRDRLTRKGLALPAGALIASLSQDAHAAVPIQLAESTLQAALVLAAGPTVVAGAISATAFSLMEGALKSMSLTGLKLTTALLVAAGLVASGAGVFTYQGSPEPGQELSAGLQGEVSKKATLEPPPQSEPVKTQSDPVTGKPQSEPVKTQSDPVTGKPQSEPVKRKAYGKMVFKPGEPPTEALADQRVRLAQAAFDQAQVLYREGRIPLDRLQVLARRLLEAQLDASPAPSRQVAAYTAYRDVMAKIAEEKKTAAKEGRSTEMDRNEAEYYRLEAELWLAKAKAGKPVARKGEEGEGEEGGALPGKDPRSLAIRSKLDEAITFKFPEETPLEDVLKFIKISTDSPEFPGGIPIYVDPVGLNEADQTMQSPVSPIDLEGVPLRRTLHLALKQLGLAYGIRDGMIMITSQNCINDLLTEPDITEPTPFYLMEKKAVLGELSPEEMEQFRRLKKMVRESRQPPELTKNLQ